MITGDSWHQVLDGKPVCGDPEHRHTAPCSFYAYARKDAAPSRVLTEIEVTGGFTDPMEMSIKVNGVVKHATTHGIDHERKQFWWACTCGSRAGARSAERVEWHARRHMEFLLGTLREVTKEDADPDAVPKGSGLSIPASYGRGFAGSSATGG